MGFQFLGPGITVLSSSDPRPPAVDEAAQGSGSIEIVIASKQTPEKNERLLFLLLRPRWLKDDPGRNSCGGPYMRHRFST